MWDKLSMHDKAKYIKLAIQSNVTDIGHIRDTYNSYARGGYTKWKEQIRKHKGIIIDGDDTYDYERFFKEEPTMAWDMLNKDSDAHFIDKYKYSNHPSFSDESMYSGYVNDHNPKGIKGGHWYNDNTYVMSEDQFNSDWDTDKTLDYFKRVAEEEKITPPTLYGPDGSEMLRSVSAYPNTIYLETYRPLEDLDFPIGHSIISLDSQDPELAFKNATISSHPSDNDYNLITNNCSDDTRKVLEAAFKKKMNPFLFTTPGDSRDFLIENGGVVDPAYNNSHYINVSKEDYLRAYNKANEILEYQGHDTTKKFAGGGKKVGPTYNKQKRRWYNSNEEELTPGHGYWSNAINKYVMYGTDGSVTKYDPLSWAKKKNADTVKHRKELERKYATGYSNGGLLNKFAKGGGKSQYKEDWSDKVEPYTSAIALGADAVGLGTAATGFGVPVGAAIAGIGNIPNLMVDGYQAVRDWYRTINDGAPISDALWNTGEFGLDALGAKYAMKGAKFVNDRLFTNEVKILIEEELKRAGSKKYLLRKKGMTDEEIAKYLTIKATNTINNSAHIKNLKKETKEKIEKQGKIAEHLVGMPIDGYHSSNLIAPSDNTRIDIPIIFGHLNKK